ncbi:MAG: thiamine phosphate synthase [Oscillospiraceae bacterium]|nr:thiamine phosphate synthase [Oscillospiraceae bacterium]
MLEKKQLLLYAITDRSCIGQRDFFQTIEQALQGGVTILQLREKNADRKALIETAKKVKRICEKFGVPLIVNDDYLAAAEAGADGVHIGIEDASVAEIRKYAGKDFIIGATAKTVGQAKRAEAESADYLGIGAVFPSPTKTNAVRITAEQFREIKASVSIPAVAIGGISMENLPQLSELKADGFAVISAVFGAEDVTKRCEMLKRIAADTASA